MRTATTISSTARARSLAMENCARAAVYLRTRQPGTDYKRELIMRGGEAANHLHTYRRSVLEEVGEFDESLRCGEDLDMALRIAERFRMRLVPEFLHLHRIHPGSTTGRWKMQTLRFLTNRWRICRSLAKTGWILSPGRGPRGRGAELVWNRGRVRETFQNASRVFRRASRKARRAIPCAALSCRAESPLALSLHQDQGVSPRLHDRPPHEGRAGDRPVRGSISVL